jgi:methyl-accepting chemotaxis protein
MDQQTLLILLTIFVAIAAIALLIQACMLIGLLIVARRLQEKVMPLIPQVEGILGVVKRTTERVEKHIEQIGTASESILEVTKQQLARVDELMGDATTRAKVQMERAEMVLDDTMTRVQETVSYVQSGVLRPVREVYGVLAGIRTALAHLGKSGRSTVDHATSDEEMFI